MAQTETQIEIKAPLKKVFEVISDFESYPDFLSSSKRVEILKKKGNQLEVEFQLDLIKTVKYVLQMKLDPPKGLSWTFISGDFMKSNEGFWKLEEVKKGITKATYSVEVGFGLLVPRAISDALVAKNLPQMMKEFKERAENG